MHLISFSFPPVIPKIDILSSPPLAIGAVLNMTCIPGPKNSDESFPRRWINYIRGRPQASQAPAVTWSSCKITVMANIIRICKGTFTIARKKWKYSQILNKNTSPYFHSASLFAWPLTLLQRGHFSVLSIRKYPTPKRRTRLNTLFPSAKSEK